MLGKVSQPFTRYASALLAAGGLLGMQATLRADPPAVPTQHFDNARTGWNPIETTLTHAKVTPSGFGKLFTISLDANVNGQPLYVPGVTMADGKHNVLYAYTSNNANNSRCGLWAINADTGATLWYNALPNSAQWTTCTPAIDVENSTIYILTKENNDSGSSYLRVFHLATGDELATPIEIAAEVPGTGDGSSGGVVRFNTRQANCRPGLLLVNGVVYAAFAHNSDSFPYHGWILGYTFDGAQLLQTSVFCTAANRGLNGIWQSGKGLAADAAGYLYCSVGNGPNDIPGGGDSWGMAFLKLSAPDISVVDWFAPYDTKAQSDRDADTGSCGPLLIPGTNRLFAAATKFGSAFLMDADNMGQFTATPPDGVLQRINGLGGAVGSNAVAWDSGDIKYTAVWPRGNVLRQFRYDPAVANFDPPGVYRSAQGVNAGGSLAVSSNQGRDGIFWAVGYNSVVYALDATDISKPPLWVSSANSQRDGLPSVGHFQFPMIANGKVYVPTGSASIAVYGVLEQ